MMIEEFDEVENGFVGFSDYLLKINTIGFKKGESGIFKKYPSIKEETTEYIASSFKQVVEMINSSHDLIY